jgi:hypothetical protein
VSDSINTTHRRRYQPIIDMTGIKIANVAEMQRGIHHIQVNAQVLGYGSVQIDVLPSYSRPSFYYPELRRTGRSGAPHPCGGRRGCRPCGDREALRILWRLALPHKGGGRRKLRGLPHWGSDGTRMVALSLGRRCAQLTYATSRRDSVYFRLEINALGLNVRLNALGSHKPTAWCMVRAARHGDPNHCVVRACARH